MDINIMTSQIIKGKGICFSVGDQKSKTQITVDATKHQINTIAPLQYSNIMPKNNTSVLEFSNLFQKNGNKRDKITFVGGSGYVHVSKTEKVENTEPQILDRDGTIVRNMVFLGDNCKRVTLLNTLKHVRIVSNHPYMLDDTWVTKKVLDAYIRNGKTMFDAGQHFISFTVDELDLDRARCLNKLVLNTAVDIKLVKNTSYSDIVDKGISLTGSYKLDIEYDLVVKRGECAMGLISDQKLLYPAKIRKSSEETSKTIYADLSGQPLYVVFNCSKKFEGELKYLNVVISSV